MRRLFIILCLLYAAPACAENRVVVTIKPLHSLVASVMEGSGMTPLLLIDGKNSPHDFSLKPSQAQALYHADIVFYMGDHFELFLHKILPQLPATTRRISMEQVPDITLYPVRYKAMQELPDLHLWLSAANARVMVKSITKALSEQYPAQAALFQKNAAGLDHRLAALDASLHARMKKLQDKPFAVFHDATQYFDRTYGLRYLGAVTLNPEQMPSAKHLQELRARIIELKAVCVFSEPEFDSRAIDNLMRNTGAKSAMLDPEATLLTPGPDLYFEMMEKMASGMEECLD